MSRIAVRTRGAALFAFAALSTSAAAETTDMPDALQAKIDAASSLCASYEDGEFALEESALQRVDLDGDGNDDWVLDESGFACSSAASLYGGTGGNMSHFLIGSELASFQNQGWDIVTFGPHTVLLAQVHGSNCDGINPTPCVVSKVWDAEAKVWRFATTAPE